MNEDVGKLVLRLALGILILLHGIAKIKSGVGSIVTGVEGIGLPPWFAYGVYIGEIVAPIMVIVGLFARTGAFIIFVNMIFAIVSSTATKSSCSASRAAGRSSFRGCFSSPRSRLF